MIWKREHIPKRFVAWVLRVSPTSLYVFSDKQSHKDEILKEQIIQTLANHASYGHRRIAEELDIGKNRARRVMKRYGIKPYKRKARWRKRRDDRREPAPYENLIRNQCPISPNHIWVSDFTYLRYQGKFYYLATVMDLYTREIIGWHISTRHTKYLVMEALLDAVKNQKFQTPTFIHSDQGSEYCSKEYIQLANRLGIQISMSTKSSPWQNAFQESFYNNFKTDLGLEFERFESLGEFVEAIHQTLNYYNHLRIHTTLRMPPAQFKQRFLESVFSKSGT